MTQNTQYTNSLRHETSPYLLQHAHNPVQWYPWGAEALEKAAREDKPILLSVGYSACHWCHVMAHECFEHEAVAAVMNDLFVNIKVDREERPDLDKIYQTAHSLLTQRPGGWPLTVFLTPDGQIPFFAGTYFPREPRHGLPGFIDLMQRVEGFYRERQDDIRQQNDSLIAALEQLAAPAPSDAELTAAPLDVARNQLAQQFDEHYGGFGRAPKFPHPTSLEQLLRHSLRNPDDRQARHMLTLTLDRMALGGLNDQLGGGFCRYSTDEQWMIPHFEKMLYDNGPLLALYSQAAIALESPLYARVARDTADWVMREMQSPEGGYYSSLDADSEGEEGKFYVWARDEIQGLLDDTCYRVFSRRYGLDRAANFEGRWYPHVFASLDEVQQQTGLDAAAVQAALAEAHHVLFDAREQRVRPGRDDKVLTSWNGLMIRGMAIAGRLLNEPDYIVSAERALDFIQAQLWQDGRLLATYKDGRAHLNAYLDDYVFLIDGILQLLQARWRDGDLEFALALMDSVLARFQAEDGGFYFTASDHENLIQRPKPGHDDALPSGNGVAAQVLIKLGHLLGEPRYLDAAERTLKGLWNLISQNAYACNSLLIALEEQLYPGETVILRGNPQDLPAWQDALKTPLNPNRLCLAIPPSAQQLPGLLKERKPQDTTVAYVCRGLQCSPPITALNELLKNG